MRRFVIVSLISTAWITVVSLKAEAVAPRTPHGPQTNSIPMGHRPGEILVRLDRVSSEAAANAIEAGIGTNHFEQIVAQTIRSARPLMKIDRRPGQSRSEAFRTRYETIRSRFPGRSMRSRAASVGDEVSRLYQVTLANRAADLDSVCDALRLKPGIESADPNSYLQLFNVPLPDVDYIPDDFHVGDGDFWREGSWAEDRPDLYGHQLIQAIEAYNLFSDPQHGPGAGVVVAVIDSGVDYTHADLAANIWINPGEDLNGNGVVDESDFDGVDHDYNGFVDDLRGWDFTNYVYPPQPDNTPLDYDGHGTHCAGTIAAVGGNGSGTLGVAPNAKVMPVAAGYEQGLIGVVESVEAVLYAAENGADVISNSWGGPNFGASQNLKFVFEYAHTLGVVCVAAAGNGASDVANIAPASYPVMIAVAATDYADRTAFFSSFGERIDVAAPGVDILSVRGTSTDLYTVIPSLTYQPGERFVPPFDDSAVTYRSDGTSMACPHVAGLAALVLSAQPELTTEEVREVIRRSADDLGEPGFDIYYGAGRINAKRAVELAQIWPDCNANWINDLDDISGGASADIDGNGVPDECQDCDGNGIFDGEDIASGSSADCNGNAIPDGCEVADLSATDCNFNGIPDACDTTDGTWADCNGDSVPDFCEVFFYLKDCNLNLVPDDCDLLAGTSQDVNVNAVPDECEPDCNGNAVPDVIEIEQGATDCNTNGIPDECDPDCNDNGVPDACDLSSGSSLDCDENEVPDECDADCNGNGVGDGCDILAGTSEDCDDDGKPDECEAADCNGNGEQDSCEIVAGDEADCNFNKIPDACDLADGDSTDCDSNDVPDECQTDCNDNNVPDVCDLSSGASIDCTNDGVPDECDEDCNENGVADSCDISGGTSHDCDFTNIPDECELYFDLENLSETRGRILEGAARNDSAGYSVGYAGDVNADGMGDLVIGAWRASDQDVQVGAAYVVYGGVDFGSDNRLGLHTLDGSNGFVLYGVNAYDNTGVSVAGAGDVNSDGFDDVVVGASRATPDGAARAGAAYLVFGAEAVARGGLLNVDDLNGEAGFVFTGIEENDFTGHSVAGIGDVNADGFDDFAVGAYWAHFEDPFSGAAYVVFGNANLGSGGDVLAADLNGSNGFRILGETENDQLGVSVAGAGDLNDDGIADLAIGANQATINGEGSGAVYVIFGGSGLGSDGGFDVTTLNGSNGFMFAGRAGDGSGLNVAFGGDFNADGADDLLVGNDTLLGVYVAYALWGDGTIGGDGLILAEDIAASDGLAFVADQAYRPRMASAGDYNHDGIADLLLGADSAVVDESTTGVAFLVFGDAGLGEAGDLELSSLAPESGILFVGANGGDALGSGVAPAGDFDQDGADDLFIGAKWDDEGASNGGGAFVLLGFDDCNRNGLYDDCEIEGGLESDGNQNGLPDSCEGICIGDVNFDGAVDPLDVGAVLSRFGEKVTPANEVYDVNQDGAIDPLDTGFVLSRLGTCDIG